MRSSCVETFQQQANKVHATRSSGAGRVIAASVGGRGGEVLVVTNDVAERETVIAFGASAASCGNFIAMVNSALDDLAHDLKHHNRAERNRFNRRH